MRKILVVVIMSFFSCLSVANEIAVSFPAEVIGGEHELERLVRSGQLGSPPLIEKLHSDERGSIIIVYHNSGSGRPLLDVYIYGCTKSQCSLLALKRKILISTKVAKPIESRLSKSKSEIVVITSDGVTQLKISLPKKDS